MTKPTIVQISGERFKIFDGGPNGLIEIQVMNGAQGWWHSGYLRPDDIRKLADALCQTADKIEGLT